MSKYLLSVLLLFPTDYIRLDVSFFTVGDMDERLSTIGFALFSLVTATLIGNAQETNPPQRVPTSTGIYDVKSPDDIHKFSASEIQELVRMENRRWQSAGRVLDPVPHPVVVYCFEERTFRYTGGKYKDTEIKYRLHTPKTIRYGRKYPLIVHLHGIGEAGSNNTASLVHLHSVLPLMIGPEREDFFMLVVQCPKDMPGWGFRSTKDGTLDVLMAILEHVIVDNPIHKKRITATGVSSGGWGVWELIMRHPDLFAGAVPTACGTPQQLQRLSALKHTPVWSFVNAGDRMDTAPMQIAIHAVKSVGGSMAFTETSAQGHNAWRPAMEDYHCFQWMLAQQRGSWFSPPPGTVVQKPKSLLLVTVMYFLPLFIIGFLLWGTICEQATTAWQSLQERFGRK